MVNSFINAFHGPLHGSGIRRESRRGKMTTKKELDKLIQDYLSVMGYSSTLDTFSKEKIKSHGNVQFTLLAQQLGEYGDSRTKNGSNAVACLQVQIQILLQFVNYLLFRKFLMKIDP